jgi:hypothetical protein
MAGETGRIDEDRLSSLSRRLGAGVVVVEPSQKHVDEGSRHGHEGAPGGKTA